eukprot:6775768-Pyramimonas_sp.AAC.1
MPKFAGLPSFQLLQIGSGQESYLQRAQRDRTNQRAPKLIRRGEASLDLGRVGTSGREQAAEVLNCRCRVQGADLRVYVGH